MKTEKLEKIMDSYRFSLKRITSYKKELKANIAQLDSLINNTDLNEPVSFNLVGKSKCYDHLKNVNAPLEDSSQESVLHSSNKKESSLSNKTLTTAIIKELLSKDSNPVTCGIADFTEIELSAAKYLADMGESLGNLIENKGVIMLDLSGLKQLSAPIANQLNKIYAHYIFLDGLNELDLETAIVLANFDPKISLDGLKKLPEGLDAEDRDSLQNVIDGFWMDEDDAWAFI